VTRRSCQTYQDFIARRKGGWKTIKKIYVPQTLLFSHKSILLQPSFVAGGGGVKFIKILAHHVTVATTALSSLLYEVKQYTKFSYVKTFSDCVDVIIVCYDVVTSVLKMETVFYVSPKRWYLPTSPHSVTTMNNTDNFAAAPWEPHISHFRTVVPIPLCSRWRNKSFPFKLHHKL
jgi:hypothetical protein